MTKGSTMDYHSQFVPLVRAYANIIETAATLTAYTLLTECALLLPELYAWGYRLPDILPPDLDNNQVPATEITRPLFARFGPYARYRLVYDPIFDEEMVIAYIADDLADIYHDLKRPLIVFDRGEEKAQQLALWEWRFTLRGHSGDHIVNVLRPIHILINAHMPPDFTDAVADKT